MKIAFLAMGSSNHTVKWVSYFRDQGHNILLISYHPCVNIKGIRVVHLNCKNRLEMLLKVSQTKKLLKEFQPDLIHAHYASSYGVIASLTGYRPFVLSTWGDDIIIFPNKSFLHKWIIKKTLRKADYVTATSNMLAHSTGNLVDNKKEIQVIPFGVDPNRYKYYNRENHQSIHIGTVRWLTPKYGIDYLIKAFAKLVELHGNLHLTIIGRGFMSEELKMLSHSLGLDEQVTFTGPLQHNDVIEYYKKFDIFVMPSVSQGETFGVAAVEAMATGLPVVASNIGGLPEVVEDGHNGKLVTPADVNDLFKGLEYYVKSKDARIEHGLKGRKKVETLYDWRQNAAVMSQLYETIVNKKI